MASPTQRDPSGETCNTGATDFQHEDHRSLIQKQERELEDLVDITVSSFRDKDFSTEESCLPLLKEHLMHWDGYWRPTEYMDELVRLLCEVFCFGEPNGIDFLWEEDRTTLGRLGECTLNEDGRMVIKVEPRDTCIHPYVRDRKSFCIGILLHELCHARILSSALYAHCSSHEDSITAGSLRLLGINGHGAAWFLLACYVELAARSLLPDLDIRLGIPESIERDRLMGGSLPGTPEQLRLFVSLTDAEWKDLSAAWPGQLASAHRDMQIARELDGMDADSLTWLKKWARESKSIDLRTKIETLLQEHEQFIQETLREREEY